MTSTTTTSSLALMPNLKAAWQDVECSFERFCLTAGIGALEQMLCEDAQRLAGAPHSRGGGRVGHRWGRTKGKIGFHGGKVAVHRPRTVTSIRSASSKGYVIERLPKPLNASVRKTMRQAWELDDADKAERLLCNLARRLEGEARGVATSILEGLDEMLTVNRLGLPAHSGARSPAPMESRT